MARGKEMSIGCEVRKNFATHERDLAIISFNEIWNIEKIHDIWAWKFNDSLTGYTREIWVRNVTEKTESSLVPAVCGAACVGRKNAIYDSESGTERKLERV